MGGVIVIFITGFSIGFILGHLDSLKKLWGKFIDLLCTDIKQGFSAKLIITMVITGIISRIMSMDLFVYIVFNIFILGIFLLFMIRHNLTKCEGKDCNSTRCDITIVKLYGKTSYTLIIAGVILTFMYELEKILS